MFFISKLLKSLVDDGVLELVNKNNKFPFNSSNVTFFHGPTILI